MFLKQALVTGANGFLGSHLVRHLVAQGVAVTAIDREGCNDRLPQNPLVRFVPCDLKDILQLGTKICPTKPDTFYHLAWQGVSPDCRDNFDMQLENVGYCLDCVRLAARLGAKRFVLPGSTMEYLYNDAPIDETSRPTPQNAYGSAKVAARFLCQQLSSSLGVYFIYTVLASLYGIGREDSNVVFYTIDCLLKGKRPSLTKLEQKWDFLHVQDAAEALFAIGQKGRDGGFYAIGNGENLPLASYLYMIRDIINPALPLGIGDIPYTSEKLPNSAINTAALRNEIGFVPKISFREGIAQVIAYYKDKYKEGKQEQHE